MWINNGYKSDLAHSTYLLVKQTLKTKQIMFIFTQTKNLKSFNQSKISKNNFFRDFFYIYP